MPKSQSKNRIKQTAPLLKSREAVEAALNEILGATINRNKAALDMDRIFASIRERYEPTIAACNEAIQQRTEHIRVWAEAHPEEFGKLKSLEFASATIGFRTGTPALGLLSKWSVKTVLQALKKSPFWRGYVRTKEIIDRQAIIADRRKLTAEQLQSVGIRILQEESFFIEPKLTEQENKITEVATTTL